MTSRGGMPPEELSLLLIERMELNEDLNWTLPDLIQRYINSGMWINPADEAGTIAVSRAETNGSSPNFSVSPALSALPLVVVVPPTDRDVWLFWKVLIGITTAGQGAVVLDLYETTDGGAIYKESSVTHVSTSDPTTTLQDNQMGQFQLGVCKFTRQFTLYGRVIREAGSGLNANIFYGVGANQASLRAVAL